VVVEPDGTVARAAAAGGEGTGVDPAARIERIAPTAGAVVDDGDAVAGIVEHDVAPADAAGRPAGEGGRGSEAEPASLPPAAAAGPQLDLTLDSVAPSDIRTEPGDTPSFVRDAERAARWRQPRVRAALAAACVLATVGLAGQWAIAQRDLVAARWAAAKPLLDSACSTLGCEVRPPRALEGLRVESSGLARVEKGDLYRLSVALRNLRRHEVALPAIELALTDTQGQLIARRVLRAAELGARADHLAAGAELMLQATLQVGAAPVAGYTIELFYP
jgi:hypothetical protein